MEQTSCTTKNKASHAEIASTKSSRRLMRQISALGMEDPVFGSSTHDAMMASCSSIPAMMDLFEDMGFDDLPPDMRDAVSVASDPTAAYSRAVQLLMVDERESVGSYDTAANNKNHPPHHDGEDTTTCTLTKDTLLAEAAQALEGRVSTSLLNVARHQLASGNTTNKHKSKGGGLWKPQHNSATEHHRTLPTMDNIFPMS